MKPAIAWVWLAGCVMQSLFGGTHKSTVQLLAQHGCEVRVPSDAGCCGALLLHNGAREQGLALARRTIAAFDALELDAVLTNAAGCGAAMREYGEHFKDDPALRSAAKRVADKVQDVAEFLHGLPESGHGKTLNRQGGLPRRVPPVERTGRAGAAAGPCSGVFRESSWWSCTRRRCAAAARGVTI